MWAKKLEDPALIDQLEAEMREGKVDLTSVRPPLLHFDQVASGFLNLTNQIIALRSERSGNGKLNMAKGPEFPVEIVEKRLRAHAATKRMSSIERAQNRWRERHQDAPSQPKRVLSLPPMPKPMGYPQVVTSAT